jgi:NMD protein affecting ribosome stability and mRNA decay
MTMKKNVCLNCGIEINTGDIGFCSKCVDTLIDNDTLPEEQELNFDEDYSKDFDLNGVEP